MKTWSRRRSMLSMRSPSGFFAHQRWYMTEKGMCSQDASSKIDFRCCSPVAISRQPVSYAYHTPYRLGKAMEYALQYSCNEVIRLPPLSNASTSAVFHVAHGCCFGPSSLCASLSCSARKALSKHINWEP